MGLIMPSKKALKALKLGPVKFPMDQKTWDEVILTLDFTPQQKCVVRAFLEDKPPKKIAQELGITLSAVRKHLQSAYENTNSRGDTSLVIRIFDVAMDLIKSQK